MGRYLACFFVCFFVLVFRKGGKGKGEEKGGNGPARIDARSWLCSLGCGGLGCWAGEGGLVDRIWGQRGREGGF